MNTENEHSIHLTKVRNYYNTAQKYYERIWYANNIFTPEAGGLGLHYGFWSGRVGNRIEAIVRENEILADFAEIKPGELVLDAGSGVAGSGIWLAKNKGARVVELNVVEKQLQIGKKLANKNSVSDSLDFLGADFHYLPFSSESFDVFWSLESMEHSDKPENFISEAFRVLKPGGRMIIAATFKGEVEANARQQRELYIGGRAAGAFNKFLKPDQVIEIAKKAGFINIENIDMTYAVMPSAKQMKRMCRLGLPFARLGHKAGIISQIMVDNTAWGTYQKDLFEKLITSYNVLAAQRP